MEELILKYALQNAVKFEGKANIGPVIGKIIAERPELKGKELAKKVQKIVAEVNKLSIEQQRAKLEEIAPELLEKKVGEKQTLPELPNVKGKVVMRLAPFPSGPLHIGNARPYIVNDEYVKRYKGKLLLVIDDTIGSDEKGISEEAYKLIPEGLEWLGIDFNKKIVYKSDRLEHYYKYAEELIKKDKAYVCHCSAEILRDNRAKGDECECRSNSLDDNLKKWKDMFKAEEGSSILRIKTDMKHKNPAFRDRVLFRISDKEHPKTKTKYRVWPLLEFSWAVDDYLLKMTHVLRGKELMMESEMERYIWDIFGWKHPEIIHTGLLHLEGIKISKSKSKKEVESGKFFGWNDPRTWSLQSLRDRGFQPEAIRAFCLGFGLTQTEVTAPIDSLYAENKKIVEATSNRYIFVEDPKMIIVDSAPELEVEVPYHPDFPKRGVRKIKTKDQFYVSEKLKQDQVYRLLHILNFKNNKFISEKHDQSLNAKIIQALPVSEKLVNSEILMSDGSVKKGLAEEAVRELKQGDVIQFFRFGFCRLHKIEGKTLVFWYAHS